MLVLETSALTSWPPSSCFWRHEWPYFNASLYSQIFSGCKNFLESVGSHHSALEPTADTCSTDLKQLYYIASCRCFIPISLCSRFFSQQMVTRHKTLLTGNCLVVPNKRARVGPPWVAVGKWAPAWPRPGSLTQCFWVWGLSSFVYLSILLVSEFAFCLNFLHVFSLQCLVSFLVSGCITV